MPLIVGNTQATQGMAEAMYMALDAVLRPPMEEDLEDKGLESEQIMELVAASRASWKRLGFALAQGIVGYLKRDSVEELEYAEAFSSSAQDSEFWAWLTEFAQILRNWSSNPSSTVAQLKSNLGAFLSGNPTPEDLKGILQ